MANDKKFIVKNGLQTNEDVLIGTSTDDGVSRLQVDGATKISGSFPSYPTVKVINTSGSSGSPIISFEGSSGSLEVQNISTADFGIFNSTNGIEFHNGNDGLIFKQNGDARLTIESGNTSFTGLSTTNIEGRRIITTDDEARNGGSFDADTVDGLQAIQFVRADEDDTMDGSYIITGNLTVFGTTTSINSEIVTIADNILQLNSNVTGTPSEDSGIEVVRGTSDNVQLKWIEASDWWSVGTYSFETDELRSTNNSDLSIRAAGSSSANVNITGGFGTTYIGLKSVFTGSEGYGEVLYGNDAKLRATSTGVEASENAVVKGDITVGDNNGAAQIFFDGTGLNSTLYSNNGEIGFLKQNFNYGAYLDSNENWVVSDDMIAQGNIISEGDVTAYDDIVANNDINATNGNITADAGNIAATTGNVTAGNSITAQNNITATTGNIDATAGDVTAGNDVSAGNDVTAANDVTATAGDVTAGQDVIATRDISAGRDANITEDLTANNAYITNDLTADDIISQTINANSAIIGDITANNIVADQDIRSGRFVDNDDDTYFGDFNQTSQMNRIDIDDYIRHRGDTDTFLGFDGNDQITMRTGGTERVNIDNNSADFTVGVYAPTFYDSDDSNYFVNPAGSSIMSNIFIDDYIYHAQAVTDFMGFSAANNWRVTLGNTMRFNVTNAITQSFNDVRAPRYLGPSGTTYFLDIDASGQNTSLALQGNIQLGNVGDNDRYNDNSGNGGITFSAYGGQGATTNPSMQISGNNGGWSLVYLNRIDIGNNPFSDNNRYIDFAADGSSVQTIRGDGGGNLNFIPATDTSAYKFWNASADNLFTINGGGDVVVGGESATYANGDFTPLVGSKTNSRLHVAGGIQLNGNDDAIVFGRGTSSFLKDEELGFGWGGGWYMTEGTFLRVRNNKTVYSTGDYQGARFMAQADTNYYVDPDGDSQLNTIDIDDYIRHRGDVNTYMGFETNDTIRFWTNGTQRLNIDNNSVDASVEVRAPRFVDSNNANYYGDFASTSNMNRIDIDDYIRHRGDTNTYFGFPVADTIRFWTGAGQRLDINNTRVLANNAMHSPIFYDSDNTAFYGNFASRSNVNSITVTNNTATSLASNTFQIAKSVLGSLHFANGSGTGATNGYQAALTFMGGSATEHQAGIYVHNNNSAGTAMAFTTTDSYATGPQLALTITNTGRVNTLRSFFQAAGSVRAPIFYDSNNTSWYVDPNSSSRMNTIVLNDGVTLRSPNGTYGSFAIDGQARGGWEGFSIGDRMVFMHDNSNRVGVFNDVDDEWIWYADRNNAMRLMYNGGEQFRTDNGYAIAGNQMRSPIFYDSNNTSYYGDFASTSIMNVVRVNRLQIDGSTYYIDTSSSDYGSIRVEGAKNGWAGYAIRDDWVFMSNGPSEVGIYNDTNNEWALRAVQNDRLYLYFNGRSEAETRSGYFDITRQARAPIYYDRNSTSYYGDFASHSRMSSISIGNQGAIANNTYAASLYHNNRYLLGMRYSGAAGNYPWLVHDNWNGYDGTNRDSFIVHFNGIGDRMWVDREGNFRAFKSVSAPDISLDGGNEPLSLSPAYGSGGADLVLFDGTYYFDNRVTNSMAPNENSLTTSTSEFVRATTGPFAGSYVLRTSGYRDFYSAFIPVEPGEELYGEISVRRISGSGGILYYGIERYDQNRNAIGGNAGTTYFVVSGSNDTSTSWSTKRGYHTLPSNVYYVRIRILMNYSGGGALREFGGIMLKRSNYHGRLRGDDIVVTGDVTADRFFDRNNTSYYLDPASTSYVNDIRFNIGYDRNNTNYYINPASTSRLANIDIAPTLSNGQARIRSIMTSGYPALEYSDSAPGNSSGDQHFVWGANDTGQGRMQLRWRGGTAFGSAWYNEGTLLAEFIGDNNAVQFPQGAGVRSPIFYDYNNTGYYVDPASTSRMIHLRLSSSDSYLKMGSNSATQTTRDTNRPQIEIGNNHAYPHFTLSSWGTNTNHGAAISFRSRLNSSNNVRRWNIGTANYQAGSLDFGYYDNQENPHYGLGTSWSASSFTRFIIRTGYTEAKGSMRSPIFYDTDNTGYYGNFASTSRMNVNRVNETEYWAGGQAHFYTSSGNLRGYIGATETNDAHLIIATSGGEDISFRDGGTGGTWNMIIRGDGNVLINNYSYATRFYDRNNTGYYGDFASTSSMATILVDRINMRDRGDWITFYGDDSTYHAIASRDNGGNTADDLRFNSYGNIWINLDSNNNNSSSADFRIGRHGAATGSIQNLGLFDVYGDALYVYTAYSFRSPIYYDSNNTGYYINAASTSRLNTLLTNRLYFAYDNNTGAYFDYPTGNYGTVQVNGGGAGNWEGYSINGRYVFMSADNNQVGIYNDLDNEWMWYGERNGRTYFYYNGRYEARTESGYFRIERQARAPIYYDLNNTGYYLDPASTSNLNVVNFRGKSIHTGRTNDSGGSWSYAGSGTRLREYLQNTAMELHSGNDAPVTIYFRSGVNAPSDFGYITYDPDYNNSGENGAMVIGAENDGTGSSDYIRLQGRTVVDTNLISSDNSTIMEWLYAGSTYGRINTDYMDHISDMRSPLFYDRNNTGYYLNPASTSNLNAVYINRLRVDDGGSSGHIYTGDTYMDVRYGATGGGGMRLYDNNGQLQSYWYGNGSGEGGLLDNDGSWAVRVRTSTNPLTLYCNGNAEFYVYTSYTYSPGSSRAPIFYDSNNTGYYFNGASTNSTRFLGVNNRTMAYMALPGHTRDSGEYYRARPRQTSDTNYWTGAMGWGRQDMTNTVADWGSGFIDSWSNPANQPSGTSHWVGVQAYHYSNGSARYGWQMVGGPIGNLRFRNTWASFSSWRTIPILDVNSSNGGSMYAGRYYDSNNTGYYSDPASTSRYNQIRANTYYSPYAGGDSNLPRSSYPYGWGFQEDGGWSNPYPDLVLQYHTGITMAAYHNYNGISFRQDYNSGTLRFRINGGSHYAYKYTWMYTNTSGYYSGTNSWHIEPNTQTSYGSMNIRGSRNGWYGISFHQADNDPHLMFNQRGNGAGGIYWQGGGRWALYYYHNDNCLGIASSTTSSTYELYVSGDIYATGNIVAYSDRRRKRNIETIDNALEKVLQLRGVSYNKLVTPNDEIKDEDIADYLSEDGEKIKNTEIGVIAQEVEEILPEVVTYAADVDEYSVNYGNMAGLFVEAFKDQQEIINSQQEQIDELKQMVQTLMERL